MVLILLLISRIFINVHYQQDIKCIMEDILGTIIINLVVLLSMYFSKHCLQLYIHIICYEES